MARRILEELVTIAPDAFVDPNPATAAVEPAGRQRRRALLIVNRGSRFGRDGVQAAAGVLSEAGIELVEPDCTDVAHLDKLIRRHSATVDCAIIGGGDGTLNAAAPALVETGLPLGILPLGTANDLARTLGLPVDLAGAARVIAAGKTRRIDVGRVNERLFFNVASIGLSVTLTGELTPERKRRWGRLGYVLATIRVLSGARPFSAWITANGETHAVKTVQVAVGNGRYYGAGLTIEERARIDDGKLDLYSLEVSHPWKLALIYPAFRHGRHKRWRDVRTLSSGAIEIRTRKPRRVNTDGEITTTTPARFSVLCDAVAVYAP
jgi:diacylglycerol kinase (ATP)